MKKISRLVALVPALGMAAFLMSSCGSDDDDDDSGGAPSYQDMTAALESPTGTVDATTVGSVAEEFEKANSSSMSGSQEQAPRNALADQSQDLSSSMCTSGGSATMTGSGSESSGSAAIELDACCMAEDCCYSGQEYIIYSSAADAQYSICYDYDFSVSCSGENMQAVFAGCMDAQSGSLVYSITVDGQTYTVTGSYSGGNGTLTITGANGTWECTYTDGSGTCTGTGGDFDF